VSYFCQLRPIKNYWPAVSFTSWGPVMDVGVTRVLLFQKWGSCPSLPSAHITSSAACVCTCQVRLGGILLVYLEGCFCLKKMLLPSPYIWIAGGKEICLAIHISCEVLKQTSDTSVEVVRTFRPLANPTITRKLISSEARSYINSIRANSDLT